MFEKLLAALEALTAAINANTAAQGGAEAPKKTRAQKAVEAVQAAPTAPAPAAAAPASVAAPAPAPAPAPAASGPVPTMEEAISLTKDLAKKDRNAALATLVRHGAPKATELKAENLAAYVADVRAQLAPPAAAGDGLI